MFAAVVIVNITVAVEVPLSVTLGWLKLQSAPAGKPDAQLPPLETVELVKLTVPVKEPTEARVMVAVAVCPAAMLRVEGVAVIVKGALTFTVTAGDVDDALIPLYLATIEFVPFGSKVVAKVAVPLDSVAVPNAVLELLL